MGFNRRDFLVKVGAVASLPLITASQRVAPAVEEIEAEAQPIWTELSTVSAYAYEGKINIFGRAADKANELVVVGYQTMERGIWSPIIQADKVQTLRAFIDRTPFNSQEVWDIQIFVK